MSDLGDIDGDGLGDFAIASPEARYPDVAQAGRVQVIFGRAWSGPISLESLLVGAGGNGSRGFVIKGKTGDCIPGAGRPGSLAALGDLDGDGLDDFAIAAPRCFGGDAQRVYIVYGRTRRPDGSAFQAEIDLADVPGPLHGDSIGEILYDGSEDDAFADKVTGVGDLNADSHNDVAISATFFDGAAGVDVGAVFVYFGKAPRGKLQRGLTITGESTGGQMGQGVSGGVDLNEDGHDDLMVCAPSRNAPANSSGSCYLLWGGPALGEEAEFGVGRLRVENGGDGTRGVVIDGGQEGIGIGSESRLLLSLDTNADNYKDLVFGCPQMQGPGSPPGRMYVLFGGTDLAVETRLSDLHPAFGGDGTRGFILEGPQLVGNALAFLGFSMAEAGDVNRDGRPDLMIGAPGANFTGGNSGRTYFVHGRASTGGAVYPPLTVLDDAFLQSGLGSKLDGFDSGDRFGEAMASITDFTGDGLPELLIGAPNANVDQLNRGIGYLYSSSAPQGAATQPVPTTGRMVLALLALAVLVTGVSRARR